MKKTDFNELKNLTIADLLVKADSFRKDLADLVLAVSDKTNKGKDVKLAFKKRKDLAQVLTVVSQKRLLEKLQPKAEPTTEEKSVKVNKKIKIKKTKAVEEKGAQ